MTDRRPFAVRIKLHVEFACLQRLFVQVFDFLLKFLVLGIELQQHFQQKLRTIVLPGFFVTFNNRLGFGFERVLQFLQPGVNLLRLARGKWFRDF